MLLSALNCFKHRLAYRGMEPELKLIDFFASWCQPCRAQSRVLRELRKQAPWVKVVKVNVETRRGRELAAKMKVRALPTLVLEKDGREVKRWVGFTPISKLLKEIEKQRSGRKPWWRIF